MSSTIMAVVCSYVVKELIAVALVESFRIWVNNLAISGSCRCLAQRMEAWVRGLIATGKGKPKSVNRGRFNRVLRRKE